MKFITDSKKVVLDVGCGAGALAKKVAEKGNVIDGITISERELSIAKPHLREGWIWDLENGLPSQLEEESYDYVICSHVLEHIAYPEKLLSDINRVLKDGGALIVALPNVFHYKSRWQLIKGNFLSEDAGVWDYTHLRWFSFKSAAALLSSHFQMEEKKVTGFLPAHSISKRIFPSWAYKRLYSILASISPGLFGYQLLYKLKNKK